MLCRFGPTVIDYLEEDDAYRIYVYWCVLGGYLSLLGAVCRLRRTPLSAVEGVSSRCSARTAGTVLEITVASSIIFLNSERMKKT